ncbi:hypothetical protein SBD_6515 [Streptomyces bottropensis ATCC 25435]|uniref:Uncharacterized protein n=1 Tax=Streptomyces bottropensis ATCC 25435 TaxID=1054862 RepID=M3FIX7_9ACTN|nr:hypothetical protein SBD_6515 [Streptomyces bottropensis ATCC 25435]
MGGRVDLISLAGDHRPVDRPHRLRAAEVRNSAEPPSPVPHLTEQPARRATVLELRGEVDLATVPSLSARLDRQCR